MLSGKTALWPDLHGGMERVLGSLVGSASRWRDLGEGGPGC